LPFYYANTQQGQEQSSSPESPSSGDIVYREGKPYRKVTAKNAEWAKNIF
jgi:hypothetical protein